MFSGVTFYTEGGRSAGLGHVARSIALADALSRLGVPVNFIINDCDAVTVLLESTPFTYTLCGIDDFRPSLDIGSVVVVDTKKDFTPLALFLKEAGKSIIAIDNLKLNALCDSVIVPSVTFDRARWVECGEDLPVKGVSSLYGGSDYVIVAQSFLKRRSGARVFTRTPLNILVSMGGSDPNGLSELLVKTLPGIDGIEVSIVVGPAVEISETLRAVIDAPPENFSFVSGVKNLAPLAASADLVFTALGITVYEIASIGVPSVLIGNYGDDVEEMSKLESMGICRSLGFYKDVTDVAIKKIVRFFRDEREELALIGAKAMAIVDGRGAERIAGILNGFYMESTARKNGTEHA